MSFTLDLLIPVSCALCLVNFCGESCKLFKHHSRRGGTRCCARLPKSLLVHIMHYVLSASNLSRMREVLIVSEVPLQICAATSLYFAHIFKFPLPLQNYPALLERQPFLRHLIWLSFQSIRWLWIFYDWHHIFREYHTTYRTINCCWTSKLSLYNLC
jgi:hypothetical protein